MPALQDFSQCSLHLFQMRRRQLHPICREIKNINCHLPFSVDESNFDVALVIGKARRNRVQQPGTVLRDHLRLRKRSRSALLDEPAVVILFDPERTLRTYSV
jgi:hypothetical protein